MKKTFLYILYLLSNLVVIYFWFRYSGSLLFQGLPFVSIALGRLTGLLAVMGVLTQFLLMGRAPWIEQVFGLDKLAVMHQKNGKRTILLILAHPLLLTFGYSLTSNKSFIEQFIIFLTKYPDVLLAFIALILFTSIVYLSLYIVWRRLKYESWYLTHLFTYVAVLLAWGHQLTNGEDFLANKTFTYYWYFLYLFVFGNHLLFRFAKPLYLFSKHQFAVHKVVRETHNAISLYITGTKMQQFNVLPGQFMIFRFLTSKRWWQAHPFSLSQHKIDGTIRITPKNVGDFTSQLASIKPGTPVIIDGPYGVFTAEQAKKNKILLFAAGIGITPIRTLIEQFAILKKDVIFLYSNKTKKEIVFESELREIAERYKIPAYFFLTQEKVHNHIFGRINKEQIAKLVPDVIDREVYICGPQAMIQKILKELDQLHVPINQIHFEKFSLH